MPNTITIPPTQTMILTLGEKQYVLALSLSAIAKAEEMLGRSLKLPIDWYGASAKDIPAFLTAGLSTHHPEVTSDEIQDICDSIDPEQYAVVVEAFGAFAFPRWTADVKMRLEQAKASPDVVKQ